MAIIDTSLLDLDRAPTIEELRDFFKKHDWSAAKITDPNSRSPEKIADMADVKKIIDNEVEKVVREKGIGVPAKYYKNKIRVNGERGNVI